MLYYITLNGREFPLTLREPAGASRWQLDAGEGQLELEVVSHPDQGRPGLVLVDGNVYRVFAAARPSAASARSGEATRRVLINGRPLALGLETQLERRARPNRNKAAAAVSQVRAPMPGRVVKVNVRVGDSVVLGTPLLGIEAMKMENELSSPGAGRVAKVAVAVGETVEADQELIVIDPVGSEPAS